MPSLDCGSFTAAGLKGCGLGASILSNGMKRGGCSC